MALEPLADEEEAVEDRPARFDGREEVVPERENRVVVLVTVLEDVRPDDDVEVDWDSLAAEVPGMIPPVGPMMGAGVKDNLVRTTELVRDADDTDDVADDVEDAGVVDVAESASSVFGGIIADVVVTGSSGPRLTLLLKSRDVDNSGNNGVADVVEAAADRDEVENAETVVKDPDRAAEVCVVGAVPAPVNDRVKVEEGREPEEVDVVNDAPATRVLSPPDGSKVVDNPRRVDEASFSAVTLKLVLPLRVVCVGVDGGVVDASPLESAASVVFFLASLLPFHVLTSGGTGARLFHILPKPKDVVASRPERPWLLTLLMDLPCPRGSGPGKPTPHLGALSAAEDQPRPPRAEAKVLLRR